MLLGHVYVMKKIKTIVPHKSLDLLLFRGEGFLFLEWLAHRGLAGFVQMKGDCYPELVEVFYNNLKVINSDIHSRVKGVDIIVNDDVWLLVVGLKAEGGMPHMRDSLYNKWTTKKQIYKDCLRYPGRLRGGKVYLHKGLDKEEKMCAYILAWLLLLGRYLHARMSTEDLFLLNALQSRIPTNWVAVFKKHMIDIGINDEHNLPYGVFIKKVLTLNRVVLIVETKVVCNRTNEIGKAILTCIGMKKIIDGWVFRDVKAQARNIAKLSDSNDNSISFTPRCEFERFVMNKFKRTSKRTRKLKKFVFRMENKMDELIKNYLDSSSSTEGSDEDEESSEEDSVDVSNLE
ncbi:hypothetical protein LR48_Vigan02g118300 [Vigna angularis]|uniref:Uncharacterized protein n=1 Tax=Phaseolus angularis TaxID=3914 RepID=A0A0L9TWS4_PHAAN|nr:hypothetical protein LR48_Vigan02g118300 [Vigna angularis]